ncbi:MAG TPA: 3-methyl-2-oxobutanoate hydroxymethyltransferase [Staphylococcus sp.]|nr:3-methyl-2-oxobutanoate hydroxymethyltransferase [Staphylococcus sp.]
MKTLNQLIAMKQNNEKISMVTAYDYPSARQVESAQIDTILVGDSLGMTVLGYESTVQVTVKDMIHHAKAVRRGAPDTFIVVDVPFGAVGINEQYDTEIAVKLYQQTQANAIKAEGGHLTSYIERCSNMGIPVVSHLGLTPQSVGISGYKMQANTKEAAQQLIDEAYAVQEAGAIMLVLEAIPSDLATEITANLDIPVIGIGAGNGTNGQVLVYHDVLNYEVNHQPKFVKRYGDFSVGIQALAQYNKEVKAQQFPDDAHTYKKKIMDEVSE